MESLSLDENSIGANVIGMHFVPIRDASWSSYSNPSNSQNEILEDSEDDGPWINEIAGAGSKNAQDEEESLDTVFAGLTQASTEKLLENILGKAGAKAHKKSLQQNQQQKGKVLPDRKPVGVKKTYVQKQALPQQDDSEEEEGRTSAFSSRKSKGRK